MDTANIQQGSKIKTVYGDIYEVMEVVGHFVKVYEHQGYVHFDKIVRIIR